MNQHIYTFNNQYTPIIITLYISLWNVNFPNPIEIIPIIMKSIDEAVENEVAFNNSPIISNTIIIAPAI